MDDNEAMLEIYICRNFPVEYQLGSFTDKDRDIIQKSFGFSVFVVSHNVGIAIVEIKKEVYLLLRRWIYTT